MSSGEKFDVAVVGAGPAGLSAAYFLAKKGFSVVVLERGMEVGAKNVFGGRIYSHVLDGHFPGWRDEAPVERWVRRERFSVICKGASATIDYSRDAGPRGSFTAFLGAFLRWLSSRVEAEGGLVASGVRVDAVDFVDGYASGVRAGADSVAADYVVIAEGANSLLLEKHGLRRKPAGSEMALGVKEVIRLGEGAIDARFGAGGEGVAHLFIGHPIRGVVGGGFLYTMREHVALGLVMRLSDLGGGAAVAKDVVEDLRAAPAIRDLVGDGVPVEYSAHLVWEGGRETVMEEPFGNGYVVVGDAAGFLLNTGFTIRGVDMAMESGRLAAEAIAGAHGAGSRDREGLSRYRALLEDSFVLGNMRRFSRAPRFLSRRRLYAEYVDAICGALGDLYSEGAEAKGACASVMAAARSSGISIPTALADMWEACRSI